MHEIHILEGVNTTDLWPNDPREPATPPATAARFAAAAPRLARYYAAERLGADFTRRVPGTYLPMAAWLARRRAQRPGGRALLLGLNGSQGSGKSTLAGLLCILLRAVFGLRVVALSLDDFYLTRAERHALAKTTHPLFITRGPPGTHDTTLARDTLAALSQSTSATVAVPRFDKATDDRAPRPAWREVTTPLDIIIFEGWCVGARPQPPRQLQNPINQLEREQDPAGVWRRTANACLADDYRALFAGIEILMMLKAPHWRQVYAWRSLQERKLRERAATGMDASALRRFVMHYERLTRHQLAEMPRRADALLRLDGTHQIAEVVVRGGQDPA